ncbi:MAG: hypothetical protein BMS9Abin05_1248 [Rhodothermia bacterium]|nr:MAG: hypothetical protein BMS9Abin05_1248 [Rhodothermia bacterium]
MIPKWTEPGDEVSTEKFYLDALLKWAYPFGNRFIFH